METYKISTFARLAGVTVRTLQHYDRTGVLKPSDRTESGYRLYTANDLFKLQQIRTLKWMGFSLKEATEFLEGMDENMAEGLAIQKEAMQRRAGELTEAVRMLELMIDAVGKGKRETIDVSDMRTVLWAVEHEYRRDWSRQFLAENTWKEIRNRVDGDNSKDVWATLWKGLQKAYASGKKPGHPDVQRIAREMRKLASQMAESLSEYRPVFRAMAKAHLENQETMPPFMQLDPDMTAYFAEALKER